VEYAIAAIQNAAAAIGILTQEGIVVVTEKKISSKLLSPAKSSEKIYKIADHCFTAVAGLTSDANILVNHARLAAARYEYSYSEAMPVEGLVQQLSDYVHGYTQSGGLRPFGVAFLYAGWDRHYGYQLYQSDPSGNYR
jgi:20S proteasome subunit alpha 3